MFVVDGIKLIFLNQAFKMRKLERNHATWSQQVRHASREVIEIRDLRQHVIADDEIGAPSLRYQSLRQLDAKEFDQCRNIFLACHLGDISRGLDAGYRNS